jgi:PhzF family phenazine biosynthesis protein
MTADVLRYSAFTDHGLGGNPAGIVLDATDLTDTDMLAIAADVGYSETAFLTPTGQSARFGMRYFSPRAEVAFCGHATIASAVALADRAGPGAVTLDTVAGPVAVATRETLDGLTASLTSVPTRTTPAADALVSRALDILGWDRDELDDRYPPHVAYAGNDHLVLGAATRERLADLDYDFPALELLMAEQGWTTVHLFWAETPTLFHARNPFPPGGVVEDPATGAAAAAFGGYLRALHLVPVPSRVTILQGQDMGAPSRLIIDLDDSAPGIELTGRATRLTGPIGG